MHFDDLVFQPKLKRNLNEITHHLQGMWVEALWGWAHLRIQDGLGQAGSLDWMGGFQKGMQAVEEC